MTYDYKIIHQEILSAIFNERLPLDHRVNLVRILIDKLNFQNEREVIEIYYRLLDSKYTEEQKPDWEIDEEKYIICDECRLMDLEYRLEYE